MALARSLTGASLPAIGKAFDRDHTTVLSAIRRVGVLLDRYPEYRDKVNQITASVRQAEPPCPAPSAKPLAITVEWNAIVERHRARMAEVRAIVAQDKGVEAVSRREPGYRLLLSAGVSRKAWRLTSFRDGQPVGHREYDVLEGGGPTQNALQEFSSQDLVLVRRPKILRP